MEDQLPEKIWNQGYYHLQWLLGKKD